MGAFGANLADVTQLPAMQKVAADAKRIGCFLLGVALISN
jgi:hypothetical protein